MNNFEATGSSSKLMNSRSRIENEVRQRQGAVAAGELAECLQSDQETGMRGVGRVRPARLPRRRLQEARGTSEASEAP